MGRLFIAEKPELARAIAKELKGLLAMKVKVIKQ